MFKTLRPILSALPVATLLSAAPSFAQDEAAGPVSLGVGVQMLPTGNLKMEAQGDSAEADTAATFAIAPSIDYRAHPNFFIGFSPKIVLNVKGEDGGDDAATEFDFFVRLTGVAPVAPKVMLYGQLAPGYSIIRMPKQFHDQLDALGISFSNPKGFVVGFSAGVIGNVASNMYLTGGLGYQVGFQGASISGGGQSADMDLRTRFLQVEFGVGVRL